MRCERRGGAPAGARTVLDRDMVGDRISPPSAPPASAEGEPAVVLSYSSIAAYRDCPRQYWYRHVQRLPAVQSAEAVQGVIMHETLRRAGEAKRSGEDVTAGMLRSLHHEVRAEIPFPDSRRAATFERNAAAQLEAFREKGGLDATPEFLEQPFSVAVDGWTLNGVIDRIDRADGSWR